VFRESLIEERVVRVEDLRHRAVGLEQILEEADGLLVDGAAQLRVERREQLLVLLLQFIEPAYMYPLSPKLDRECPDAFVSQHGAFEPRAPAGRSRPPRRGDAPASGTDDQKK
jgi:hypothetical protein